MCDLVENRIANLSRVVQIDELPRKGDGSARVTAGAESAASIIEPKRPADQAVLLQQQYCQVARVIQIQIYFPSKYMRAPVSTLLTD